MTNVCTRNLVSLPPLDKYLWQERFKSPQAFLFFLTSTLQNVGLKVVPQPAKIVGIDTVVFDKEGTVHTWWRKQGNFLKEGAVLVRRGIQEV